MHKKPRRKHSPGFKAKVALAALTGDKMLISIEYFPGIGKLLIALNHFRTSPRILELKKLDAHFIKKWENFEAD